MKYTKENKKQNHIKIPHKSPVTVSDIIKDNDNKDRFLVATGSF